ncbi:Glutathione S-transferase kappa [Mycena sanguinolenta]|uniref:Glutathione S-transferase kappa n=1 Tax=Mycena sanguinolenta TaxID=230812 RepID=A0A8H6YC46_9AGAR|nr:Glutathione S-transferase kappa [Mycena sanguinolenta]
MAQHIDCYLDITSLYSFFAFVHLLRRREVLATHNVSVDFHPVFLGGINVGSGNKPPWSVPAKKVYGEFESKRAKEYFGLPELTSPTFFPILSLLPQRAMCYIKATFPQTTFEQAWLAFFRANWIPPHANLSEPDAFCAVLRATKLFSDAEVLDQGAFGAPWLWVRDATGKEEPFFGSDRFHFVWQYLGLPWKDIELLPKQAKL